MLCLEHYHDVKSEQSSFHRHISHDEHTFADVNNQSPKLISDHRNRHRLKTHGDSLAPHEERKSHANHVDKLGPTFPYQIPQHFGLSLELSKLHFEGISLELSGPQRQLQLSNLVEAFLTISASSKSVRFAFLDARNRRVWSRV